MGSKSTRNDKLALIANIHHHNNTSSNQPKEAKTVPTFNPNNVGSRRVQRAVVESSYTDALQWARDIGHLADDRPTQVKNGADKIVSEMEGFWLYHNPFHKGYRRSFSRMLVTLLSDLYELDEDRSDLDNAKYTVTTRPNVETWSGFPNSFTTSFVLTRTLNGIYPIPHTVFHEVRGWGGQIVTGYKPADWTAHNGWFERTVAGDKVMREAAQILNHGGTMDDLTPAQREMIAKAKPKDGHYYEPGEMHVNAPHFLELTAQALGQQRARSLGATHRIGFILANSSNVAVERDPKSREAAYRHLALGEREYDWSRDAVAGNRAPVSDGTPETSSI